MDEAIEKVIWELINKHHELGDGIGGSGHMATIYASMMGYQAKTLENGTVEIVYKYSIIRESEFTVYTEDSPGGDDYKHSFHYQNGQAVYDEPPQLINSSMDPGDFLDSLQD